MYDYSGPMHAAAADLMAFTGHPSSVLHHPSSALLSSPLDPSSVKSETLQGLNPPVCYHESLPTHFLPLNLEIAKQPSDQSDICQPASGLLLHAQTRADSPKSAHGPDDGTQPGTWVERPPDGLPAVERYSKMVANVLQVCPCPPSHCEAFTCIKMSGCLPTGAPECKLPSFSLLFKSASWYVMLMLK